MTLIRRKPKSGLKRCNRIRTGWQWTSALLIEQLVAATRQSGLIFLLVPTTAISIHSSCPQAQFLAMHYRTKNPFYVRWNAMMMVLRANKHTNVGGHIASFASAATLYDVVITIFGMRLQINMMAIWFLRKATWRRVIMHVLLAGEIYSRANG